MKIETVSHEVKLPLKVYGVSVVHSGEFVMPTPKTKGQILQEEFRRIITEATG